MTLTASPCLALRYALYFLDPAVHINKSGTRREELLMDPEELQKMWVLRKVVHDMDEIAAVEFLLNKMRDTKTNSEFFESMKK